MDALYILKEEDLRRWLREEINETLKSHLAVESNVPPEKEQVLSRQDVVALFKISTVTLNTWMSKGLPHYRQSRRVFFLLSEIMSYLQVHQKNQKKNKF